MANAAFAGYREDLVGLLNKYLRLDVLVTFRTLTKLKKGIVLQPYGTRK